MSYRKVNFFDCHLERFFTSRNDETSTCILTIDVHCKFAIDMKKIAFETSSKHDVTKRDRAS